MWVQVGPGEGEPGPPDHRQLSGVVVLATRGHPVELAQNRKLWGCWGVTGPPLSGAFWAGVIFSKSPGKPNDKDRPENTNQALRFL